MPASTSPAAQVAGEQSMAHLRELVQQAAGGHLTLAAFVAAFRATHAQSERPAYRSKEEARLIWDMLWAIEFYSPDPAQEEHPEDWNDDKALLAEIRRVARRLTELAMPKRAGDPRFETYPWEVSIEQLRWYIRQTAAGVLTIHEFLADFREVHERIEQVQRPAYASREEGQALWDVLWAVEYCSQDIAHEESPEEWYIPEEVLMVVRQSAKKLGK